MTKTYRFNRKQTYARIIVKTAQGGQIVYEFTNGNPMANVLPKCVVKGEWEQEQLEKSVYCKNRIVALESISETEEEKRERIAKAEAEAQAMAEAEAKKNAAQAEVVEPAETPKEELKVVAEVSSVTQATAYIYENFGVTVKSAIQAQNVAKKNGIVFPNLKVSKKK